MSSRENKMLWGRCTWILFHNIADKIGDKEYVRLKGEIFGLFKNICINLPCRICSGHAERFVSNVHINSISTRELFKSMLFQFHNYVNKQTGKRPFLKEQLRGYEKCDLPTSLYNFNTQYTKRYNTVLMAGYASNVSRRYIISTNLHKFMTDNWNSFNL
jgi:hypothetical protein